MHDRPHSILQLMATVVIVAPARLALRLAIRSCLLASTLQVPVLSTHLIS